MKSSWPIVHTPMQQGLHYLGLMKGYHQVDLRGCQIGKPPLSCFSSVPSGSLSCGCSVAGSRPFVDNAAKFSGVVRQLRVMAYGPTELPSFSYPKPFYRLYRTESESLSSSLHKLPSTSGRCPPRWCIAYHTTYFLRTL